MNPPHPEPTLHPPRASEPPDIRDSSRAEVRATHLPVLALAVCAALIGCSGESPSALEDEPKEVTAVEWVSVSIRSGSFARTCGITTSRRAYCWGSNPDRSLGADIEGSSNRPVPVLGDLRFQEVSPGWKHTCGLAVDGFVHCWGDRRQIGIPETGTCDRGSDSRTCIGPTRIHGDRRFETISAGVGGTCALTPSGEAFCWGTNGSLMGNGTGTASRIPTAVSGGHVFTSISVGSGSACAVDTDGQAFCWGLLATSAAADAVLEPTPLPGGYTWKSISLGGQFGKWICGVTSTDTAACAPERTAWSTGPVELSGFPPVVALDAGPDQACALADGGRLYCLGTNPSGVELVSESIRFVQFTAGSCGVDTMGVAYCWGSNFDGQLGVGDDRSRATAPTRVADPLGVG